LPIAEYFHKKGNRVFIECNEEYHGVFDMVDYATPCCPNSNRTAFDRVIDLQIWPNKYDDWRSSGLNWIDYIYKSIPEGHEIDRQIHLNVPPIVVPPEVKESVLCFPTGYSQSVKINPKEIIMVAHLVANGRPVICVGKKDHGFFELDSIPYLCAYIKNAFDVVTINSSPSIICSAYRKSWYHIAQPYVEDFYHPNQKRLELDYKN